MNSLIIEPNIIIFGPTPPNKLQIGPWKMKMIKPNWQTTILQHLCYCISCFLLFLLRSKLFFLWVLRLTIWIFVKKIRLFLLKRKKKCAKKRKKKDRWIQITNQVNVLVVSESGVHGWPLVNVWGGMVGVFGY